MRSYGLTVAAAAVALLLPSAGGAAPTAYTDPSGDNGTAADIGLVTVEAAADGFIVIRVAVANLPALGEPGFVFAILDTDRNAATGSVRGGDYALVHFRDGASFALLRWSGSEFVPATGDAALVLGAGTVEFRVRPAAIGGATAFNFVVAAETGGSGEQIDVAPDGGTWFFQAPVRVTAEEIDATFVPALPRAGRKFTAPLVRITLSDGRTILASKYRCVASLGGRPIRGTGKGGCTFTLPKNAKGKRLRVTFFVTYDGVTDEYEPYVFKVR